MEYVCVVKVFSIFREDVDFAMIIRSIMQANLLAPQDAQQIKFGLMGFAVV